jgi:soluble lytic murein transglycosylase-like protein
MNRIFFVASMALFSFPTWAAHRKPANALMQRIRLDYIEAYIEEAASKERLEPALLRALIRVESNFNHKARSRVGARGLMQIMPFTAEVLGNKKALDQHNPRANILAGTHYLRELINQFGGDLRLALAAYNAGPRAVEKYHGVPPYSETRAYVRKVMAQLDDEREFVADAAANGG